jgi:hypothetical protein
MRSPWFTKCVPSGKTHADRESWPRIRARALEFIDQERSWAHSVARYGKVYRRILRKN